jgi:hypothetical protein
MRDSHQRSRRSRLGQRIDGLLEHRREAIPGDRFGGRHFHRKSPFFDRLLRFDVQVERESAFLN